MKICWYMEDLKVSHIDPKEINKFMERLEGIYGELRIIWGKVKISFGTTLEFLTPGELQLTMVDDLQGVPYDLPEVIMGQSTILVANNIFQV